MSFVIDPLHPLGQRVAAIEHQTRDFEREQADRRQQDDGDQPEIARKTDHAARPRTRALARSAKAWAAAATDFGSRAAVGSRTGGLAAPTMRMSRVSSSSPAEDLALDVGAERLRPLQPSGQTLLAFAHRRLQAGDCPLGDFSGGNELGNGRAQGLLVGLEQRSCLLSRTQYRIVSSSRIETMVSTR